MDFLDKLRADHLCDGAASRSGDKDPGVPRVNPRVRFHPPQKLETLFGCLVSCR